MKQIKYFLLFVHGKGAGKLKDEECIAKFLAGDEKYFSVLVEHHRPGLLRYTSAYIRDRQQCEDIVQDVFTAFVLLLRSGRYRESGKLQHLLAQMAHHHVLNFLEHVHIHDELFSSLPDKPDIPDKPDEEKYKPPCSKMKLFRAAWRLLKTVPRKIFMLRYHQKKSFEEIGRLLNMKPHTAMSIHTRTINKLRNAIAGNT
jgi:RNA polymerase sigma-70 factor, ECF subfamily